MSSIRRIEIDEAMSLLAAAVIGQAICDIRMNIHVKNPTLKRERIFQKNDAKDFIRSERLDSFLKTYGLTISAKIIREKLKRFL